ncbi:hypothetical protein [Stigmatella aurantiaca]|uniref:Lipoprotein n=1 Tax=Stigmatella aurantiaca (strain DW4/3-1) TaxID=378806 RepID=Q08VG9_STIAD|nr:hypothetical protein [Stigmatella aurantiaca]ADO72184.1 uncharacterized protein STAUR_4404 [Stigmatella aurantiaca DW4/3-1]EAU64471.1 hypothetical protein STIAU_6629 [Stigmatella aurantiaca DW4/3-1]
MRFVAMVGLLGVLSGCGPATEAEAPVNAGQVEQQAPPETWCNSYKTQQYCPTYAGCYWLSTNPVGTKCTAKAVEM